MEATPSGESITVDQVIENREEQAEMVTVSDPRGSRSLTQMASDDDMGEDALEEEFRRLYPADESEVHQGEIRHQQQEIEELREVRKQLAEREAELMRLRRLLESSERTRRDDAAEIGSVSEGAYQREMGKECGRGPTRRPEAMWTGHGPERTACDASVPREYSGMLESRDRENQSGPGVNPLWGCGETSRVAMIVPAILRALKRATRWQTTEVFYYWTFQDLHPGRTFMFDRRIKHVIFVLPATENGVGSWNALADAVAMWVAAGAQVFLVAGPRTGNDAAWIRLATKAREILEKHIKPAFQAQIHDTLPRGTDVVEMHAPCAVLGVVENAESAVTQRQACAFYTACRKQLTQWVQLEDILETARRRRTSRERYPHIRTGRIGKRSRWDWRDPRSRRPAADGLV